MGNCCSVEGNQNGEFLTEGDQCSRKLESLRKASDVGNANGLDSMSFWESRKNPVCSTTFLNAIAKSKDALIVLASGCAVECEVQFDRSSRSLHFKKNEHSKDITITSIKAALHTAQQLAKVDTMANITHDPNCCAILLDSGHCIVVRFEFPEDTSDFVKLLESEIDSPIA